MEIAVEELEKKRLEIESLKKQLAPQRTKGNLELIATTTLNILRDLPEGLKKAAEEGKTHIRISTSCDYIEMKLQKSTKLYAGFEIDTLHANNGKEVRRQTKQYMTLLKFLKEKIEQDYPQLKVRIDRRKNWAGSFFLQPDRGLVIQLNN